MYIKYVIDNDCNCDVYLGRALNIFNASYKFNQTAYGKNPIIWHYLIDKKQYLRAEDYNDIEFTASYDTTTEDLGISGTSEQVDKLQWIDGVWYIIEEDADPITIYKTPNQNVKPFINDKGHWAINIGTASGVEEIRQNAEIYDNYGLWLHKEKKMIDTIQL